MRCRGAGCHTSMPLALSLCSHTHLTATHVLLLVLLPRHLSSSAVLIFGVIESKMAQPRNFMGGQFLSGLVGITTRVVIHQAWIAGPVGMSLALVVMMVTSTTHPPGACVAHMGHRLQKPAGMCRWVRCCLWLFVVCLCNAPNNRVCTGGDSRWHSMLPCQLGMAKAGRCVVLCPSGLIGMRGTHPHPAACRVREAKSVSC